VHNPDNALVLYTVLVVMTFMLSKRFGAVRQVLQAGGGTVKNKTTVVVAK
jgi:hypothetical protein